MALQSVTINVSRALVPTSRQGFGQIFMLSPNAAWVGSLGRTYSSEAAMTTDFPVATMPERVFARVAFAQSPAPKSIKLFKTVNKATQVYQVSAINPTANISYAYKLRVSGHGFAETEVTYTSDASPTDAEYAAGMVIALNAVAGKNYTASGAASPITITGNSPGAWFSVEVVDVATQSITETTADPGVNADLTAAFLEDKDIYFHVPLYGSSLYLQGTAPWVESAGRMQLSPTNVTAAITAAPGAANDPADRAKTSAWARTGVVYHRAPITMCAGAWTARVSPKDPGKINFAHRTLNGVLQYGLTETHVSNLRAKNGNGYDSNETSRFITFDGKAGDGSYLDFTRSIDWIVFELRRRLADLKSSQDIITYDRAGAALIEGEILAGMGAGADQGIVNPDFPVTIDMPDPATLDASVINSRDFPPIGVSFKGGQAVNGLTINLNAL
jgi:hypothetical protein